MAYDITELSKSELEQFRQLVARGRAKGINDDALFYAFEHWGLLGLSHALDTSTKAVKEGKLMGLLDEFGLNRQEAQGIARLREATREAVDAFKREQRTMQPPTRQKASAPVQKPAPEPPKPSFWPGQQTARKVMIELPDETLDKARRLLQISDDVWTGMVTMVAENTLVEILEYALARRGYTDGLMGVKSTETHPFWKTRVRK